MALVDSSLLEAFRPQPIRSETSANFRKQNESDDHLARPGEGNAVQSAVESLQRHERYTRATTDTRDSGQTQGDAKGTCRGRSSGNGSGGSSAVDRVEADIADSAPKTLRKKAKRLVERLKADIKTERNDRDEFVYDGMAVTGSNMMYFVNDVL